MPFHIQSWITIALTSLLVFSTCINIYNNLQGEILNQRSLELYLLSYISYNASF